MKKDRGQDIQGEMTHERGKKREGRGRKRRVPKIVYLSVRW